MRHDVKDDDFPKEREVDLSKDKNQEDDLPKVLDDHEDSLHTETEVDLSKNLELPDQLESSSDINELEGKLKWSECAETFSAESNLKVHLDIKHDINDSLSILEVDENWNLEDRYSS